MKLHLHATLIDSTGQRDVEQQEQQVHLVMRMK
jgi:hypothetical protein